MAKTCLENINKMTELVTVHDLFSVTEIGENCFRIPDYQRGYAWKEQFDDLLNDILRVYRNGNGNPKPHYTGMLSLAEMTIEDKKKEMISKTNSFYVVDGQQRLTSIVIILKSLFQYIEVESDYKENLEGNFLKLPQSDVYRFDYSNDYNHDTRQYFLNRIYNNDTSGNCSDIYLGNINAAKEKADKFLLKYDLNEAKKILDIVLNKLVFNIYFINEQNGFDVRVTFETMNNRGKKLSNLELLKNRLMYLTIFLNSNKLGNDDEQILKYNINKAWKNIYNNLCYKDEQLSDDEYLKSHWMVYSSLNKKKGDAYIDDILNNKFGIDSGEYYDLISTENYEKAFRYLNNYVKSLEDYSKFWGLINNPLETDLKCTSDEIKWLDKLNRISTTEYVKSSLMVIAGSCLDGNQKIELYKILERSLFVNKVINKTKNDYSGIIRYVQNIMKSNRETISDCFNELKNVLLTGETSINDSVIKDSLTKFMLELKDDPGFMYSWKGISYFLYEYNESLTFGSNPKLVDWKTVSDSIEHILPQNHKREYWTIVLESCNGDEDLIKRITNSLGNLLLIGKGENSQLQNFSYPTKRDIDIDERKFAYRFGTRSAQKVAQNDYWTIHSIYERQIDLFKFMYDNWINRDNSSQITYNQFIELISNGVNSITIKDVPDSKDLYKKLDALKEKIEQERTQKKIERVNQNKIDWYDKFIPYIDTKSYGIQYNPSNATYIENRFTIKVKGNSFTCHFRENGTYYGFDYRIDTKQLQIYYWQNDQKISCSEEMVSSLDKGVLHFINAFSRFLKREHKSQFAIVSETNLKDEPSGSEIPEEQFLSSKTNFAEMLALFNKFKPLVLHKFNDCTHYCTNRYMAFKKNKNFAEIHIEKNNLRILIKEIEIESALGGLLPDSYHWALRYQFHINKDEQFDEALKLIELSYNKS